MDKKTEQKIINFLLSSEKGEVPEGVTYSMLKSVGIHLDRDSLLPELSSCAQSGKWEDFCNLTHKHPEALISVAFRYFYDSMPEEYRRNFVINCYNCHGDSIPACRAAVRMLPKNGINELPENYRNKSVITVYRAGEEEIIKAPFRLSWTLDRKIAEFFLNEYYHRHANYLYQASIKPCDIIAYDNGREEQEIIQYRNVFDIKIIRTRQKGDC